MTIWAIANILMDMKQKKAIRRIGSVGQRIKKFREAHKFSRAELSRMCGMNETAISHFESGRREPLLSSIQRIAKALGVTLDELVG